MWRSFRYAFGGQTAQQAPWSFLDAQRQVRKLMYPNGRRRESVTR